MDKLYTLSEVFTNRIFRIPDYQRGYAWRADKEIAYFWDDLVNLDERRKHYTGQITLEIVPDDVSQRWNDEQWLIKNSYKPIYVVDGQQRLTTSIILIQCIYDLMKRLNPNMDDDDIYLGDLELKRIKDTYLFQTNKRQIINTYIFGYETDNPSFDYLKNKIFHDNTGTKEKETYYTLNLENAQKVFNKNLQSLYKKEGEEGICLLFEKLTQNMLFNIFEIDKASSNFDIFAAFETMNNRGKKLTNLELLKNRLIYLTTLYTEEELDMNSKKSLRNTINDAWKVIYAQLGRKKTQPLDDDAFLFGHWVMSFPYSRKDGNRYTNFLLDDYFSIKKIQKKSIDTSGMIKTSVISDSDFEDDNEDSNASQVVSSLKPTDIYKYVISIKEASVKWYESYFPTDSALNLSKEERLWLDRLNRIGIAYFRPLVVASLLRSDIECQKRVELFKAIERFIFLAFRLQTVQANYRNSEFYTSARSLLRMTQTVDEIISNLNDRIDYLFYDGDDGNKYFYYGYFQASMERKFNDGGGYYSWGGLRYFLYEYEYNLWENAAGRRAPIKTWTSFEKSDAGKITIEHILPQTPTLSYWVKRFGTLSDEELTYYQGTLGNLMLLGQSINSSLQNDSFTDKKTVKMDANNKILRQGYENGSYSEQEVSKYKHWTVDTIKERGLKLLSFMEERWDIKFESEEDKATLLFVNMKKKKKK